MMTERVARPRTSLRRTVLNVAAIAAVAAVLLWAAFVAGALRKRSDAAAATPPVGTGQVARPATSGPAATPAPVTTQTS